LPTSIPIGFVLFRTVPAWGDEAVKDNWATGHVEETGPDAQGIRTVTEYRRNPVTGAKDKVIRKYKRETRVIQVPKAVEERAAWRRFGKAKDGNEGTTARSVEEIAIEKPGQEAKSELSLLAETQRSIFTCRKCGGPHSTLKCPYKDVTLGGGMGGPAPHTGPGAVQGGPGGADAADGGGDGSGGGKYVPPSKKRLEAAAATGAPVPIEDLTTLRVTNLSEDAEEEDLRALFSRYGRLERVRV
jgi:translation initiation factor 3 subunit G